MSHTGVWPTFRKQPRTRSLAVYFSITRQVIDEYGATYDADSWPLLARIAVEGHYDVYMPPFQPGDALFQEMVADDYCTISASRTGGITGVRYKEGRHVASFTESRVWGYEYPSPTFLHALRRFMDYCGVGEYCSPGALGEAIWASTRPCAVSTPARACCRDLRVHSLGGRADTPGLGQRLLRAWEIDMRSAYLSFLRSVPTGTAARLRVEPRDNRIWFAPCEVTYGKPSQAFSPVGWRDVTLRFPHLSAPARFTTWLWSEEVQAARRMGIDVRVAGFGWEWNSVDNGNAAFLAAIGVLRAGAYDAESAEWIKKCGVAAIGRQAIPPLVFRVLADDDPARSPEDIPLIGDMNAPISGYWLHSEPEETHTPRVTHWWAYSLMKCRLALWERMEIERKAGNTVLLSNYDGILLSEPSKGATSDTPDYGEWKQRELRRVYIPYPRAVVSPDKPNGGTLPGVSGEERGRYAY